MSEHELRRLLQDQCGEEVATALPGKGTSLSELSFEAVNLLERRGLINIELFQALAEHAPGRRAEFADIAALWGG